ncbi:PEPxxWA-CTERM sorting domain-containing protein [Pseudothauera lacus]|nr:PEPxxWA-CTERM sorting domain-containing protein [Pseudothauera lacus]
MFKTTAVSGALLAAALTMGAGVAHADTSNGPDPYTLGFQTPDAASWGGWTRGEGDAIHVEWDIFADASYGGATDRSAAPDLAAYNASDAHIDWSFGVFPSGTGNLYSFGADQSYDISFSNTSLSGPVRAVMQVEAWGFEVDLGSVLLNGVAPAFADLVFTQRIMSTIGEATLFQQLIYWDLAAAPTDYLLSFTAPVHTSLAQVAIDVGSIAPVPEPETYAMMLAGLGLVGAVARRRKKAA